MGGGPGVYRSHLAARSTACRATRRHASRTDRSRTRRRSGAVRPRRDATSPPEPCPPSIALHPKPHRLHAAGAGARASTARRARRQGRLRGPGRCCDPCAVENPPARPRRQSTRPDSPASARRRAGREVAPGRAGSVGRSTPLGRPRSAGSRPGRPPCAATAPVTVPGRPGRWRATGRPHRRRGRAEGLCPLVGATRRSAAPRWRHGTH